MTIKGILLSSIAALAFAGSSFASGHEAHGVYVGLGAGARHNNTYSLEASEVNATGTDAHFIAPFTELTALTEEVARWVPWGWSASAFAGYQFNQTWSLQVGYDYDQKQHMKGITAISTQSCIFSCSEKTLGPRKTVMELKAQDWYVAVRAALPLTGDFGAYLMVGPAQTRFSQQIIYTDAAEKSYHKSSFWSPMAGAGVTYAFNQRLDFGLQYMHVLAYNKAVSVDDLRKHYTGTQRVSLVASYHFGS